MRFSKVRDVKTPTRGTSKSAGLDFYIPNDAKEINLPPHGDVKIPSGIKCQIPEGYMLCAFNKSGIATGYKLQVGACVADEDYQGEIHLHVFNNSNFLVTLKPGQKLVQFILIPVLYADLIEVPEDELFSSNTERGTGGFGSTGLE